MNLAKIQTVIQLVVWKKEGKDVRLLLVEPCGYDALQLLYEKCSSIIVIMDSNRTLVHFLMTQIEIIRSISLCLGLSCFYVPSLF